jgi:hypothetical protein
MTQLSLSLALANASRTIPVEKLEMKIAERKITRKLMQKKPGGRSRIDILVCFDAAEA